MHRFINGNVKKSNKQTKLYNIFDSNSYVSVDENSDCHLCMGRTAYLNGIRELLLVQLMLLLITFHVWKTTCKCYYPGGGGGSSRYLNHQLILNWKHCTSVHKATRNPIWFGGVTALLAALNKKQNKKTCFGDRSRRKRQNLTRLNLQSLLEPDIKRWGCHRKPSSRRNVLLPSFVPLYRLRWSPRCGVKTGIMLNTNTATW